MIHLIGGGGNRAHIAITAEALEALEKTNTSAEIALLAHRLQEDPFCGQPVRGLLAEVSQDLRSITHPESGLGVKGCSHRVLYHLNARENVVIVAFVATDCEFYDKGTLRKASQILRKIQRWISDVDFDFDG